MIEQRTFSLPADVALYLEKASAVLAQSADILTQNFEVFRDPDDPDWMVALPHEKVELMARNLRTIGEFAAWVSKFREGAE